MPKSEFVDYNGERFYLQSSKKYFQSGNKEAGERLLHRRVWSDSNGPIEAGMHIHHKDGDWRNNSLDNLEIIPFADHAKMHMAERWADEKQKQRFMIGLEKAHQEAKKWHSSEEGKEWHRQNIKKMWQVATKKTKECIVCESEFETYFPLKAKTCSKKCSQKLTYKNRFTEPLQCKLCSKDFYGSRYRIQQFCSRKCSNSARSVIGVCETVEATV